MCTRGPESAQANCRFLLPACPNADWHLPELYDDDKSVLSGCSQLPPRPSLRSPATALASALRGTSAQARAAVMHDVCMGVRAAKAIMLAGVWRGCKAQNDQLMTCRIPWQLNGCHEQGITTPGAVLVQACLSQQAPQKNWATWTPSESPRRVYQSFMP